MDFAEARGLGGFLASEWGVRWGILLGALGISGVLYDDNYKAPWRGTAHDLGLFGEIGNWKSSTNSGEEHVRCKSKCTHYLWNGASEFGISFDLGLDLFAHPCIPAFSS